MSLPAPSNLIKGGLKAAQASLASNPILGSLISKEEDDVNPDDAAIHRSVGVDPDFYDMVDDNIISVILSACKPLFDLVQGTDTDDPDSKHESNNSSASDMKHADLVMNTAKLIIAAGYKMKEQARQEMAEEDLGGGMFDEDVKEVRVASAKCNYPQVYDADEQQTLDVQLAVHEAPKKSLRKYKTGTKLYSCDLADTGSGVALHIIGEVRAPPEQIVVRTLWKKLDEETFFYSQMVCGHTDFPERPDIVRMGFRRTYKLIRIGARLTRIDAQCSLNLRGSIPRRINDTVTIPLMSRTAADYYRYFTCMRPADSFDEGDGTVLGRLLYLQLNPHRQNKDLLTEMLLEEIRTTNVLRTAQAKYRFFDEFLFHFFRNKMKIGASQTSFTVNTPLVALTANEAGRIARSFPMVMMANATGEAAVDELIATFPALRELDREYAWFRSMLEAIATELMSAVAYGVKARAYLGASVSAADAVSDAYMINEFYVMGKVGTANGLLAMVGANLGYQALMVFIQTQGLKKDKWRTALFEMLAVVTFSKPGLDAYRVASGAEQLTGAAMNPLMEMIYVKGGELVFEAIPGLILQLVALLSAEERKTSAYISILISTASTALTATTMFWDNDTDPGVRKRNPDAAGIVPDLDRGTAFAVVFVMCACQIVAKATATALLILTNGSWLLGYILADHALHFAYRMSRRDMILYVPMPPGASYVVAPIARVTFKVVADFTGSPLLRVPLLGGGSYWLFNLAMSQVSVFACVHLYLEYAPEGGVEKVKSSTLWTGASCLSAAWLVTFLFFVFRVAVPRLRHTLWSWTSGRQAVHQHFLERESDEGKFDIFGCNLLLWESDIGEEVKAWATENWARWKEEKPAWFKPDSVPDQFIPAAELEQLGHNRKRRGSAVGSIRESFRDAEEEEEGGGGEDSQ
ncbi:hypothetical protein TeGR_g3348 [Tetraparma gracilis]|uniref:Uncharacterized protein n=1 Tax=Tetraparma gracilis TaxID=2962635 RepID=A0ABQ6N1N0_9STRA|nr:hypothetical protein TeGR_g3348 [Tetraparma gracilis]